MKTISSSTPSFAHGSRRCLPPCRERAAFSMVEMIVVVAIVSMLFAVAAPYTFSVIQAASLSSSGDTLMQKISQAQQRATSENRPIGLDFFYYSKDEIQGCHAIQLVSYDAAANMATPIEPPVYWSEGRVVLLEGVLSPMFSTNVQPIYTGAAAQEPFKKLGATFYRVVFYPDGSTNLRIPLRTAYLTLVATKNYQKDLATPPPNYYTVQIDPVTGRGHSYRP
ncbi:Verru_Chthon cassette protein D [Prosthecobacter sp.]|uniref:Verru_Chthon cassette protein D n=1 Tax=Prosthecobacter sp. TaxID=1965333 RepID=UPI0037846364